MMGRNLVEKKQIPLLTLHVPPLTGNFWHLIFLRHGSYFEIFGFLQNNKYLPCYYTFKLNLIQI